MCETETRSKRGIGVRNTWGHALPFLESESSLSASKKASCLTASVRAIDAEKQIISKHHAGVLCGYPLCVDALVLHYAHDGCRETDTRILLHPEAAVKER